MTLLDLFTRCLLVPYKTVGEGADYYTERRGNTLYLYLEHSDGRDDWKSNLNFPAKPYKRMGKTVWFAHRGFLRVFKSLLPYIEEDIADPTVEKMITVGYSHGAALAVLCHEYIWYHRVDLRNTMEGYGFGCPRVLFGLCRKKTADRWAKFTVIRNLDDLVTHLPPAVFGFYHVGKMLEIGKRKQYSMIDAHRPENIQKELIRIQRKQHG